MADLDAGASSHCNSASTSYDTGNVSMASSIRSLFASHAQHELTTVAAHEMSAGAAINRRADGAARGARNIVSGGGGYKNGMVESGTSEGILRLLQSIKRLGES
jgi:hypothetical protein